MQTHSSTHPDAPLVRMADPLFDLDSLGWNAALGDALARAREATGVRELQPARVIAEHRGAYDLMSARGPRTGALPGRAKHQAQSRLELPAVGDWVLVRPDDRIESVLPRKSVLVRKAAGGRSEPQVIAANVDFVFIVTSANADFNPRRIERYVTAVRDGGAEPVLVLNKTDLCADVSALLATLPSTLEIPVARISATEHRGRDELAAYLRPGVTVGLVGSSGVGKSTLTNWLLGARVQDISAIRDDDERGRHTTTHRQLFVLPQGGALIDTPGMREFALWGEDAELDAGFDDIEALAGGCRFVDCQHQGQPGCAIERALANGELDPARLEHFFKLRRELEHQRDRGTPAEREAHRRFGKARARALRERRKGPAGGKLS